MTSEILNWIAHYCAPTFPVTGNVLEVGALNVNGSVRQVLQKPDHHWRGIDRAAGQDVDVVANAVDYLETDATQYDAIIACEAFEHDPLWWLTRDAMVRRLKTKGVFLFSAPTIGFPYHTYGGDFYRFTADAVTAAVLRNFWLPFPPAIVGKDQSKCVVAFGVLP